MRVGLQSLSNILALIALYSLTLSHPHLYFLILSKGGTTESMFSILSNVGCIACLLLFHTHTAWLGLTCFSFSCWPARLYSLFFFSHSVLPPHIRSFFFSASRGALWNDSHHFKVQFAVLASLTLSLSSLVLVQNHHSHFHRSLSPSPIFFTFHQRRTGRG